MESNLAISTKNKNADQVIQATLPVVYPEDNYFHKCKMKNA